MLIASLAWSAYGMLNTMLDPERSERIADTLLEDELVQQQLRESIAGAVGSQIPEAVPVSDDQLESGAGLALDNPVVSVLIRDAFVQAHQAFLGEADPPTQLDLGSASNDIRDGALSGVPGGAELLPDGPGLVIDLPTDQIPNLGGFRRWLQRVAPLMALIAAAGVALALLTAKNRASVLRRAGTWALGSSAVWLVLNVGLPWVANQYFSGQAAIASSLIDALFGEMLVPAIVLAGCGLALVVVSILWPEGGSARTSGLRTDGGGAVMRRQQVNDGPKPEPLYAAPERSIQPQYVAPETQPPSIHKPVDSQPSPQQQEQHVHQQPQTPQPQQAEAVQRTNQVPNSPGEWVPGVGYRDEGGPEQPTPTGFERPQSPVGKPAPPTWVAGIGYVDENGKPIET